MKQISCAVLFTLALWGAVERSSAENTTATEIRFQAPLAPLLTSCGTKPSEAFDTVNPIVDDFCRLVNSSRAQSDQAKRAEMIVGNIQPKRLVQALKELLRDENYALIITNEPRLSEALPPRAIIQVRMFSRTAPETTVPRQAVTDRPEVETAADEQAVDEAETTAERLERTATEAENPEDRIEALASLTALGDANIEAVLLSFRLLHHDNEPAVREAAMNVLLDLRGQDVYDVISKAATEDPSPLLRIKALENLVALSEGSLSNALEAALLQALEDQDKRVSEHAEKLLATLQ
ncbi:MAG: hypothetical protein ETSY1_07305 [Candidatus Entotheonella factor]|uniref:HEAT repeat domain-containing protein n=2 Tax=Candidatus Entotheonella TaxID=93171 RepID=W4LTS5_ENTF1|nr:MAG: hypothetical protein ETSY1_07305 [Candidatus Entotheonella factor]